MFVYLVSYRFADNNDDVHLDFFNELDALGENIMPYNGAYFVVSILSAVGVRNHLQPFFTAHDWFIVSRVKRDDAAGKLSPKAKAFLQKHLK